METLALYAAGIFVLTAILVAEIGLLCLSGALIRSMWRDR